MKVLIAPLNWGIGHAARCIPIIQHQLKEGKDVHIASDGEALDLLKAYFPKLTFHELPQLAITYTKRLPLYFKFPIIALKVMWHYRKDKRAIAILQEQEQFDIIISDNRYGVRSKKAKSYIVTHQLKVVNKRLIPMEWLSKHIIRRLIKPFNTCLIPDYEGIDNLTGIISQPPHGIIYLYTKPLSRFPIDSLPIPLPNYQILAILSGPEPQRSQLENIILDLASQSSKSVMLLRGTKQAHPITASINVKILDFAGDSMLQSLVCNSQTIIARAGYSTIMDLNALKKGAVLIPTPHQPEQEYLAQWLDGKRGFEYCSQRKKDLEKFF